MILSYYSSTFSLKFSPVWVSKKRNDKKSMICLTPKSNQFLCPSYRKQSFYTKKRAFFFLKKKKREWWIEKKTKRRLLNCCRCSNSEGPHNVTRKVHEKTVRVAIKQNLSPVFNNLGYAILGVLENKPDATSRRNICSLKTALEKEWNKMSEEFIFKACKSFWGNLPLCVFLLIL